MASSGHLRTILGVLSAIVIAVATNAFLVSPAHADPPAPPNASDPAKQLADAQHDAEALTEQWHAAQDQLQVKQGEAERAKAAVPPAQQAAEQARANEEKFHVQVDQVTTQAFESGRLDQLNALILSDSPSDFLDQMTTLESFTADQKVVLDQAVALVTSTRRAQAEADGAAGRSQQAADDARAAVDEIGVRKRQAEVRIDEVEKLLGRLSPSDKAARVQDDGDPVGAVLGTSKGALALKSAMTRMRKPYVWGATGPAAFDCSGLMFWAFKSVGITLPRSAAAQSSVGRPVDRSDLQPGDMVFFYNPVSHVGFYAGDGKVLNAVQTGDVVRYTDLSRMRYNSARRL